MNAYNYFIISTVSHDVVAWGTFTSPVELGSGDLAAKARLLAQAHFVFVDVTCDIYIADATSGDFDSISEVVATYTTNEYA